jgi:beta-glucanase (GH16 family)
MKRVLLIAAVIVLVTCLFAYISDFRFSNSESIGYQDDLVDDSHSIFFSPAAASQTAAAPVAIAAASVAASTAAPAVSRAELEMAAAQPTPSPTPAPAEKWQLIGEDEFDKPELNMEYWTEIDRRNNFNGELQYFSPANSFVEDGYLILEARKEKKGGRRYTSGMVQTLGKLSVQYGRIEARISLPVGKGFFPAFWMLAEEDTAEIDIMEMIGSEPTLIYGCNHYVKGRSLSKNWGMTTVADPEAFHVYSVEWDEHSISWYVDGQFYYSTDVGIPDEPMYLILTLAVGGEWPGSPDASTVFPSRMAVDYVRCYRAVENREG